jgi:hypothetical protein
MTKLFSFARSELFLSLIGGFALGVAGMALIKPASATQEKSEAGAVVIETTAQVANINGKLAR